MVATIVFFVSLFGVAFLFLNKNKEIEMGRPYVNLVFGSDFHLKKKIESATISVKEMPRKAAEAGAYHAVKYAVTVFDKARALIRPKIAHIIDAVRGKNIPQNRGSVSIYLKRITDKKDANKL